jgi:hypothetical protein
MSYLFAPYFMFFVNLFYWTGALAVQLVKQIKDEFEYAVWYTLDEFPTIDKFKSNLIQLFSSQKNKIHPQQTRNAYR